MLLIYGAFNFTDILHQKCNSHAFYPRFQSNYFSKTHNMTTKLPWHQIHTPPPKKKIHRLKNDTLMPYTASKNDILKHWVTFVIVKPYWVILCSQGPRSRGRGGGGGGEGTCPPNIFKIIKTNSKKKCLVAPPSNI